MSGAVRFLVRLVAAGMFLLALANSAEAAGRLRAVLCPAADAGQQVYFNTRQFAP